MLILMDVQFLQYFDFNCENRSNGQNHFLQDFHHPIKKPPSKISHPPSTEEDFTFTP